MLVVLNWTLCHLPAFLSPARVKSTLSALKSEFNRPLKLQKHVKNETMTVLYSMHHYYFLRISPNDVRQSCWLSDNYGGRAWALTTRDKCITKSKHFFPLGKKYTYYIWSHSWFESFLIASQISFQNHGYLMGSAFALAPTLPPPVFLLHCNSWKENNKTPRMPFLQLCFLQHHKFQSKK